MVVKMRNNVSIEDAFLVLFSIKVTSDRNKVQLAMMGHASPYHYGAIAEWDLLQDVSLDMCRVCLSPHARSSASHCLKETDSCPTSVLSASSLNSNVFEPDTTIIAPVCAVS